MLGLDSCLIYVRSEAGPFFYNLRMDLGCRFFHVSFVSSQERRRFRELVHLCFQMNFENEQLEMGSVSGTLLIETVFVIKKMPL